MTIERDDLDDLFAAARDAERPGRDLTARVLADAARVQAATPAPARAPRRGGIGRSILGAVGGWAGLSGLAVAGVTGLMIGVAAPDRVDEALNGQLSAFLSPLEDETGYLPGLEFLALIDDEDLGG